MGSLLSLAGRKVVSYSEGMSRCINIVKRSSIHRSLFRCCLDSVKSFLGFCVSPGPREVFLKSIAICVVSTFATGEQIAIYLIIILFYNRFYLNSVSKTYKTYMSAWIPAILPNLTSPLMFYLWGFTVFSLLQIHPEFSQIAWAFIMTFASHVLLKVSVGCLVALYSLLLHRQLDVFLINEVCSYLG